MDDQKSGPGWRVHGDHVHVSDPNQATSQPMAGGGIGGTDEGRDRDVGDDVGSKSDTGDIELGGDGTMRTENDRS